MRDIYGKLKEKEFKIFDFDELLGDWRHGWCAPASRSMFIWKGCSEIVYENLILHGTAHALHNHTKKKNQLTTVGWSHEYEANYYMIRCRAEEWISDYYSLPNSIDFERFINYYELKATVPTRDLYDIVEKVFNEFYSAAHRGLEK